MQSFEVSDAVGPLQGSLGVKGLKENLCQIIARKKEGRKERKKEDKEKERKNERNEERKKESKK